MAEYTQVLKTGDLKEGEMRGVEVAGKQLFIARAGGKFYAAQRFCPHMGGDLPKGKLAGTVVTCPRHGSQFDLKDGHVIRWTDWTGMKLFLRENGQASPKAASLSREG